MKEGVYVGIWSEDFDMKVIQSLLATKISDDLIIKDISATANYAGNYHVYTVSLIVAKYELTKIVEICDNSGKEDVDHMPINDTEFIEYDSFTWCDLPVFNKLKRQCKFQYLGKEE
jgi:hypothetical protein